LAAGLISSSWVAHCQQKKSWALLG